eukprot:m.57811 g.57811  ORF g.57811 m.57811 type:complete len:472 (+) comp9377_c0_seq1:1197-2612(+)
MQTALVRRKQFGRVRAWNSMAKWSFVTTTLGMFTPLSASKSDPTGCKITDFGAKCGNSTADAHTNTAAIERALAQCSTVVVPPGAFKVLPFAIPSHRVLYLESSGVLVGSDVWQDYGVTGFLPHMGTALQLKPLISAVNATNITISGSNGTIDGNGWFAWPSSNWSSTDCGLHNRCSGSTFFGNTTHPIRPPHTLTFVGCTHISIRNVTLTNPAFWGLQHFYCNDSIHSHVTILAPRWTREIAGFMPWSVVNYSVVDSYVAVGDDALAIMSGNDAAGHLLPTTNLTFTRLFVLGRSVAIGSADFGNVSNIVFDECTIGDDEGSSPWAFKIKMHVNVPSHVSNILFRNTKFGKISNNTWQDPGDAGGTAILMGMNYGNVPVDRTKGQPTIFNISFINVSATHTTTVASLVGALPNSIQRLHFDNCNFKATSQRPWELSNVDIPSCTSVDTVPEFPGSARSSAGRITELCTEC